MIARGPLIDYSGNSGGDVLGKGRLEPFGEVEQKRAVMPTADELQTDGHSGDDRRLHRRV